MTSVDLVVVGGGMAGFVTALAAAEQGIDTLLVEKSALRPSWSNTRISGGAMHVAMLGPNSPPAEIAAKIAHSGAGHLRQELIDALIADAPGAIAWLQQHGARFIRASGAPHHQYVLAPPAQNRAGLNWEGRGGDVTLRRFADLLAAAGGRTRNGSRAVRLVQDDGRVSGIEIEADDGTTESIACRAVAICDGGFQANAELVDRYIGPGVAEQVKLRATDTGTGDGARMAVEAGAVLVNMDMFYGCVLSRDALTNERLWPFPMLDQLIGRSMVIDETTGERFVDEGGGGVLIANQIAKHVRPRAAVVVFDQAIWKAPSELVVPVDPNLALNGGTMHTAPTLEALAAAIGTPEGPFVASIAAYNAGSFDVPRTGTPTPIVTPPFHAVPLVPAITYTLGGILIDPEARVVDGAGQPIPGLWAVGTTTGGMEGGPNATYVGGLMQSTVFGVRAARSIKRSMDEVTSR